MNHEGERQATDLHFMIHKDARPPAGLPRRSQSFSRSKRNKDARPPAGLPRRSQSFEKAWVEKKKMGGCEEIPERLRLAQIYPPLFLFFPHASFA
jgi:hypothetical protein